MLAELVDVAAEVRPVQLVEVPVQVDARERRTAGPSEREALRRERVAEQRKLTEPALFPDREAGQRGHHPGNEEPRSGKAPSRCERERRPQEEERRRGLDRDRQAGGEPGGDRVEASR